MKYRQLSTKGTSRRWRADSYVCVRRLTRDGADSADRRATRTWTRLADKLESPTADLTRPRVRAGELATFPFEFDGQDLPPDNRGVEDAPGRDGQARHRGSASSRQERHLVLCSVPRRLSGVPDHQTSGTTPSIGLAATDKIYVVQTTAKIVQRCMLMCTDPGDLVLDPTAAQARLRMSRNSGVGAGSPSIPLG